MSDVCKCTHAGRWRASEDDLCVLDLPGKCLMNSNHVNGVVSDACDRFTRFGSWSTNRVVSSAASGVSACRMATWEASVMGTFVLVRGSMHGGWCWKRVVPLLR